MPLNQGSTTIRKARLKPKKRSWLRKMVMVISILILLTVVAGGIFWMIYIQPLIEDLPDPAYITHNNERYGVSTQIFARDGQKLYEFYEDERRVPIRLSSLPSYVYQASVAVEDKKFYKHMGFDIQGIARAYLTNRETGSFSQGGSTITQQLVKKAFLTDDKSYERKIQEVFLSVFVERQYTKDQILEMYLNYIPYGGTSAGIGSAAETYFATSAANLTLAQAAFLAGLPQAPSRYSPFINSQEAARARQWEVLRSMVEEGYIDSARAQAAYDEPLEFALNRTSIIAPHFVFYVRDYLVSKYGEERVNSGGLRVTTTIDLEMQRDAEASVAAELATLTNHRVGNGAALVTNPKTGEILAMVGSRDYFDQEHDGQVNILTSLRQPGSSIKPLVYATAFEQKLLNPGTILLDVPTCFKYSYQEDYCPQNYSGGFSGPASVRSALGGSLNIPAVKAMRMIGVESFIWQTQNMGMTTFTDPRNYGLSLALGGGEVKATEFAGAFGALANQGVLVPVTGILEVTDYNGRVLERNNPEERAMIVDSFNETENMEDELANGIKRVFHRASAWMITEIMRDNRARSSVFGANSELVIRGERPFGNKDVAVKTGTTNDLRDNWTVGFTPERMVVVWVGNNDNTPMSRIASGVTGAAPIWNDIMSYLLRDEEEIIWPEGPDDAVKGAVCASGMPESYGKALSSSYSCSQSYNDYYWTASLPARSDIVTKGVWIDPNTGAPAAEGQTEGLELREQRVFRDPLTNEYCGDCERIAGED
ncbi:transglycosylase domain-containing protein, partial [Microgenomates group bacterium]|nr:transglycosylase domain-containing protein [Microgenomates group bacterium]